MEEIEIRDVIKQSEKKIEAETKRWVLADERKRVTSLEEEAKIAKEQVRTDEEELEREREGI